MPSSAVADEVVVGALLGTQANRQVAVVNTFELALVADSAAPQLNQDFFDRRKEQCELAEAL